MIHDKNSDMPFLSNEFLKIFEDLFMTSFAKMTQIYDNKELRI